MIAPSDPTPTGSAPRRRDGVRNRERLMHEAEVLFGEVGVTAPLDELARRAGVSSATLYRHFPTREELIRALSERLGARLDKKMEAEVLTAPTAREQLEQIILGAATVLVEYPCSRPVIIAMQKMEPDRQIGERFRAPIEAIVARAREDGTVRTDLMPEDAVVLALMIGSFGAFPLMRQTGMWRRYAAFVLDSLDPRDGSASVDHHGTPDDEFFQAVLGPDGSQAEHG